VDAVSSFESLSLVLDTVPWWKIVSTPLLAAARGQWPAEVHVLVYVGLLLLASQLGGRVANYVRAPRILGYLVAGILVGPSVLGLFRAEVIAERLGLITDIALAVIAFSIGGSLGLRELKRLGKPILWITFIQALGAAVLVTAVLCLGLPWLAVADGSFWHVHFPLALVAGAISAATAPAAIMSIVHEYRSRGPLTTVLLGVVALDDALTIILYAVAITLAQSLCGDASLTSTSMLRSSTVHILSALAAGAVVGFSLKGLLGFFPSREAVLGVTLGAILLTAGAAVSLGGSALLACMMLGFVVVNYVKHHQPAFAVVENLEEPLFGLFFALAGAHLDFSVMHVAGGVALIMMLARFGGKLFGSYCGARISRAPVVVRRYLGLALLPQAGVTLGLALQAKGELAAHHLMGTIVSAVVAMVLLNELITPFAVRFALFRAGEARTRGGDTARG
jgi:Kef-type K+ transport system membrane component KefB